MSEAIKFDQVEQGPANVTPIMPNLGQNAQATPRSAEMSPGPGFRVCTRFTRPARHLWSAFSEFETADISDAMNRLYAFDPKIVNVANPAPLTGPALCVKVYPGDNLMVHKALDLAEPGDIMVIDSSHSTQNAVVGDLIANKAKHRGIAGFIIDGLVRDIEGVIETGLPVYARGVTAFGPLHRGPGEINYPISCGGVVVRPGDIVAADKSGIAVIPGDNAEEILARLDTRKDTLAEYVADVKRGKFSNAWVDAELERNNCRID